MTSQNELLLNHLKMGNTISPIEAIGVYGIHRLSARIYDLKRQGHNIIKELRRDPTGKSYARYKLAE